jgi:4-hydroxymandelate oxidase
MDQAASRRKFLQFMAASPLFASGAFAGEVPVVPNRPSDPVIWAPLQTDKLIKSPKEAINVFDF